MTGGFLMSGRVVLAVCYSLTVSKKGHKMNIIDLYKSYIQTDMVDYDA